MTKIIIISKLMIINYEILLINIFTLESILIYINDVILNYKLLLASASNKMSAD